MKDYGLTSEHVKIIHLIQIVLMKIQPKLSWPIYYQKMILSSGIFTWSTLKSHLRIRILLSRLSIKISSCHLEKKLEQEGKFKLVGILWKLMKVYSLTHKSPAIQESILQRLEQLQLNLGQPHNTIQGWILLLGQKLHM